MDSYTVLPADRRKLIYLNSSVTTEKTFTLIASPEDGDKVWIANQNDIAEARLVISDGTDDIFYLGLSDGVYEFTYSSVTASWSIDTA